MLDAHWNDARGGAVVRVLYWVPRGCKAMPSVSLTWLPSPYLCLPYHHPHSHPQATSSQSPPQVFRMQPSLRSTAAKPIINAIFFHFFTTPRLFFYNDFCPSCDHLRTSLPLSILWNARCFYSFSLTFSLYLVQTEDIWPAMLYACWNDSHSTFPFLSKS